MGNELADAIRTQLRLALLGHYGTLEIAAEALGMPYKTLYRHLTTTGKDRTARVSLDFVLDVANHLQAVAGIDFAEIHRRAQIRADVPALDDDQENYDLAARPRATDRGEDME
ncbi:hypothetical protein MicroSTF_14280 [Microbacterium sp. STF-2]|uniref:hypothetical protein n=1 Tax=Microbacterium sp. STF-2 TaxID=3031132 RepID=UPI002AFEB831|nr:hypothetical protein [Microbacterium sp. STF-2]MEA1264207.1 hypothetical protein [Microbacterium sp. STF-2]